MEDVGKKVESEPQSTPDIRTHLIAGFVSLAFNASQCGLDRFLADPWIPGSAEDEPGLNGWAIPLSCPQPFDLFGFLCGH